MLLNNDLREKILLKIINKNIISSLFVNDNRTIFLLFTNPSSF